MSFLALSPAFVGLLLATTAACVAFLYWLKPPPKRVIVPSAILWNRLLREKKKQTWLDRLRWWISLVLALAIGLSVATALGRPELGGTGDEALDVTIVIDNSATMATRAADGYTRWEHALAEARALLQEGNSSSRFLVADTAGQAPPTGAGDRRAARDVLDGLTISLGGTVQFPPLPPADAGGELYFVSDGVMVSDVPPEAERISVFEAADNVGITAFEIRSVPAAPLTYQAFLEVTNASARPKDVSVRLSGSGSGRLGETLTLAAGESQSRTIDLATFDRGPVRVALTTDGDAFEYDDYAFSFLPVRNRTRIALVSSGSVYLESALAIETRIDLRFLTPSEYNGSIAADAFIFDGFAPPTPPPGPALLFLPPDVPWLPPTQQIVEKPAVGGWNKAHEVLQFVSLEDLRVDRAARAPLTGADVGSGAEVVVGTPDMPLISAMEIPEKILRVSFALTDSNFPLQPGFPIFLSNALAWMMDEHVALSAMPGRVEVPLPAAAVQNLEGEAVAAWALSDRTVFVAEQPGLYTAQRGTRRLRVAVNVADRRRSAINRTSFGAEVRRAASIQPLAAMQPAGWGDELWVLLLTIAALLVIGEWFTYHRRITV